MLTAHLGELDLLQVRFGHSAAPPLYFNFPVHSGTGTQATSVVYMELEPGGDLCTHTDSAEEIVLVLEGTLEGRVGDERGQLTAGQLVVIPSMMPHGLRNTGPTKARAIGFFASAAVVSTFDQPALPINRRILGTPLPAEEPQAEPV